MDEHFWHAGITYRHSNYLRLPGGETITNRGTNAGLKKINQLAQSLICQDKSTLKSNQTYVTNGWQVAFSWVNPRAR